ncbi:hypothetical protein AWB70_00852 [Caballeronia cordobensis]|uniref:Uncharacterized protein n=1 Tax=Caballeronia cordobensis TaxID=1353886 RepID=A0A158FFU8_CABCO|nr:hypothetical protein AWB70_00852 [Caballeronia cordobensis]
MTENEEADGAGRGRSIFGKTRKFAAPAIMQ